MKTLDNTTDDADWIDFLREYIADEDHGVYISDDSFDHAFGTEKRYSLRGGNDGNVRQRIALSEAVDEADLGPEAAQGTDVLAAVFEWLRGEACSYDCAHESGMYYDIHTTPTAAVVDANALLVTWRWETNP